MSKIHLLNVKDGDCTIFEHASGRSTMIDICAGNIDIEEEILKASFAESFSLSKPKGNYAMCKKPTNPVNYFKDTLGRESLFRFIISHPDMDHLDGFNQLADCISITNLGVSHFLHNYFRVNYLELYLKKR